MAKLAAIFFLVTAVVFAADDELALRTRHAPRFLGEEMSLSRMRDDLDVITGERELKLPGRPPVVLRNRFTPENKAAAREFFITRLRRLGYEIEIEDFGNGQNVVATLRGTEIPHEAVEVSAHYDSVSKHGPGADDNGSGVVALLETARLMAKTRPKRTVRMVMTDLEEHGFDGSRHHAAKISADKTTKTVGVLVLDQIGYTPGGQAHLLEFEIGEQPGNVALANQLYHQQARYRGERPISLFPVTKYALPETGDHGSYWANGIPAVFISENLHGYNPAYHQTADRAGRMNWEYFENAARLVAESAAALAGADVPESQLAKFRRRVAGYESAHDATLAARDFVAELKPDEAYALRDAESRLRKYVGPYVHVTEDADAIKDYKLRARRVKYESRKIRKEWQARDVRDFFAAREAFIRGTTARQRQNALDLLTAIASRIETSWEVEPGLAGACRWAMNEVAQ